MAKDGNDLLPTSRDYRVHVFLSRVQPVKKCLQLSKIVRFRVHVIAVFGMWTTVCDIFHVSLLSLPLKTHWSIIFV